MPPGNFHHLSTTAEKSGHKDDAMSLLSSQHAVVRLKEKVSCLFCFVNYFCLRQIKLSSRLN
jgi:hypothetical protein